MPFKSFKEESKKSDWGTTTDAPLNIEQINLGAMLRIADATEKMAQRHTELIDQRDYYKSERDRLWKEVNRISHSNAALRGHLRRIKARMESEAKQ